MLGLIARIKKARADRRLKEKLMAEQSARIAKGFAELHTSVELVAQAASGRGPQGEVLRIGDGFYVERAEDGTERSVNLEKNPEDRYTAHLDNFQASLGDGSPPHRFTIDVYRARADDCARDVDAHRLARGHGR
ncbi:hypothetical protein COAQ111491_14000 [Comamonas aquatilis]|uniref:hypothetical protein n=1 Tax=Comamonas aquatilis TaxID=1778406 RepID=UPI0039F0A787